MNLHFPPALYPAAKPVTASASVRFGELDYQQEMFLKAVQRELVNRLNLPWKDYGKVQVRQSDAPDRGHQFMIIVERNLFIKQMKQFLKFAQDLEQDPEINPNGYRLEARPGAFSPV